MYVYDPLASYHVRRKLEVGIEKTIYKLIFFHFMIAYNRPSVT